MKTLRLLPVVLLCCLTAAHAQQKYDLRYAPIVDTKWQEKLSGEVVEALVQGQAMGITGDAAADLEMHVVSVDEGTKRATNQVLLKNIKANLNGQVSQPSDPDPMVVIIDERGKMSLPGAKETAIIDWAETGGIPLQFVLVIAHMIRLPVQPVACGEEWSYEDIYPLPGMGDVSINTRWKLMEVDEQIATITATAAATVPDFKIPNPMAPGAEVDVKGARISITQMTQKYDMAKSRVTESEATVKVDARLDMGGFEMPLLITLKSKLEPVEAE
jgi:hypothetical protein